ncbi:MAG: hypothetical protein IT424_00480 [Pirellulales bacterium]|nr:hypothetical protein [Pirellulales bacterium]
MRQSLVLAVSLATCAPCVAQEASVGELLAQADPAIQAQIKTTFGAFASQRSEMRTNWIGFRELASLKEQAGDEEQLVKQLAIYAAVEQRPEDSQVLEALLVLHFLEPKPRIAIRVLAPLLDSENEHLRDFAQEWFEGHLSGSLAERSSDVRNDRDYVNYVRERFIGQEDAPAGFVKFLFEQAPGRALLVFAEAFAQRHVVAKLQHERAKIEAAQQGLPIPQRPAELQRQDQEDRKQQRELRLAEHVVGNAIWLNKNGFDEQFQHALPEAKELLAKLAEHQKWWARLFVAEIMRRHRELRIDDVLERLRRDSHALVSAAAGKAGGKR